MTWLRWWFVDVPVWGWENIAPLAHGFGGLVLLALGAIAYAAVTLLTLGGVFLGVAALCKAFMRGVRSELGDSRRGGNPPA